MRGTLITNLYKLLLHYAVLAMICCGSTKVKLGMQVAYMLVRTKGLRNAALPYRRGTKNLSILCWLKRFFRQDNYQEVEQAGGVHRAMHNYVRELSNAG